MTEPINISFKYPDYTETQIVAINTDTPELLFTSFAPGWVLLEIFFAEVPFLTYREEADPSQNWAGAPKLRVTTGALALKKPFAILGRKENSVIAELNSQVADMNMQLTEAKALRNRAEHLLEESKVMLKERQEKVDSLTDRNNTVWRDYRAEQARMQKLEKDIAKIRTAIGELKMKEILADKEPKT